MIFFVFFSFLSFAPHFSFFFENPSSRAKMDKKIDLDTVAYFACSETEFRLLRRGKNSQSWVLSEPCVPNEVHRDLMQSCCLDLFHSQVSLKVENKRLILQLHSSKNAPSPSPPPLLCTSLHWGRLISGVSPIEACDFPPSVTEILKQQSLKSTECQLELFSKEFQHPPELYAAGSSPHRLFWPTGSLFFSSKQLAQSKGLLSILLRDRADLQGRQIHLSTRSYCALFSLLNTDHLLVLPQWLSIPHRFALTGMENWPLNPHPANEFFSHILISKDHQKFEIWHGKTLSLSLMEEEHHLFISHITQRLVDNHWLQVTHPASSMTLWISPTYSLLSGDINCEKTKYMEQNSFQEVFRVTFLCNSASGVRETSPKLVNVDLPLE